MKKKKSYITNFRIEWQSPGGHTPSDTSKYDIKLLNLVSFHIMYSWYINNLLLKLVIFRHNRWASVGKVFVSRKWIPMAPNRSPLNHHFGFPPLNHHYYCMIEHIYPYTHQYIVYMVILCYTFIIIHPFLDRSWSNHDELAFPHPPSNRTVSCRRCSPGAGSLEPERKHGELDTSYIKYLSVYINHI